jgi:hypothetical protein
MEDKKPDVDVTVDANENDVSETFTRETSRRGMLRNTKETNTVNVNKSFVTTGADGEGDKTTNSTVQVVIQKEEVTKIDSIGKIVAILVSCVTLITLLITLVPWSGISGRDNADETPPVISQEEQEPSEPDNVVTTPSPEPTTEPEPEPVVSEIIFTPDGDITMSISPEQFSRLLEAYDLFEELSENRDISIAMFDTDLEYIESDFNSPYPLREGIVELDSNEYARALELQEEFGIIIERARRTLIPIGGFIQNDRTEAIHTTNIEEFTVEPILIIIGDRDFTTHEIIGLLSINLRVRILMPESNDPQMQGASRITIGDETHIITHRSASYRVRGERIHYFEIDLVTFNAWNWSREYTTGADALINDLIKIAQQ